MMSKSDEKLENKIKFVDDAYNHKAEGFKYIRIVAMIYLTLLLAATVVAYRVVIIGPFSEPGSTLIYAASFFVSNIYTELYGPRLSKKLIWEAISCGYLFALLLSGINLLPAPSIWDNTDAYNQVLGHVFRFTNAGIVGYLISSFLNIYLIDKWKHKMNGNLFWLRSFVACSISEGVATFVAGLLSFVGMMQTKNIIILMTSALIFKIAYGFIAILPASFFAYLLKKKESLC